MQIGISAVPLCSVNSDGSAANVLEILCFPRVLPPVRPEAVIALLGCHAVSVMSPQLLVWKKSKEEARGDDVIRERAGRAVRCSEPVLAR